MEDKIDRLEQELHCLPPDSVAVVRDCDCCLLERRETVRAFGTMLASEPVLSRDWGSPEEDAAWDDLYKAPGN